MFSNFENKTILITGGCGYLASALIRLLCDTKCRVIRLDRPESDWSRIGENVEVNDLAADIRDPQIWEQALDGVDIVFHFAAQTSAYCANDDPTADHLINVQPMLQLLEACRRQQRRPAVCFSSTVTVAGIPASLPVNEQHPDHPLTLYDLHKQMAEQYLQYYAGQGVVRGVALRLTNIYGPGPASSRADRGVLNRMIRKALAGEPLTVYGSGELLRDYLFVDDAAGAFLAAAAAAGKLNGRRFVIGSGEGHTIAGAMEVVAQRTALKTGVTVAVDHIPPPASLSPIEERNFVADSNSFMLATGWKPAYSFALGIDRTLEAFS